MKEIEGILDTEFFKALSEPSRIELIKQLIKLGKADISTLSDGMSQDRSVVSRHLKVMLQAGLVVCEKEGRHSTYWLNGSSIVKKLEHILALIKGAINTDCC